MTAQSPQDPDWTLYMSDPNANVDEVITLFNQQWQNRTITPGCGYKPFKRWEHLMHGRISENGLQEPVSSILREYEQALEMKHQRSESGNWQNLGPILDGLTTRANIPGVGRTNHVAFHPTNPNIIFCGTPAGGLWRTYDGGQNWETNTDDLPTLGVSAVAFDPFDPNIVYIGTGDRDAGDAPGMGVMRSTDAGLTWEFVNQGFADQTIGDIQCDPENPGVVLAACRFGMRRSIDFGQTWVLTSNTFYFKHVLFKPGDSNTVYATAQGRFYRSDDNGQSWSMITSGVGTASRFVIGVTPADPERVYVCAANTFDFKGFYVSNDAGLSFTEMSDQPNILGWTADGSAPGGQAWFDLCMEVDPINPDRVFVGGIRMKRSDDAGTTWIDIQNSYLHVDHHWCKFSPHDGQLYLCNDGGIYRYLNQQQWVDISDGIVAGQIYKFGQGPISANKALSGYQDNGTMEFNGVDWLRTGGADGFECQYDPFDETWQYNSIYYGQIYRTNHAVTNEKICGIDELGINEDGAWSTPWFVTAENPNKMFVGLKNVWRTQNIKDPVRDNIVWEKISDNLDATVENIAAMYQSQVDTNTMYVSKGNRKLFRSNNLNAAQGEVTWTNVSSQLPSGGTPVTAIVAHPVDSNTVTIGFNNSVWQSTNRGIAWTNIGGSLPEVRINGFVYDITDNDGLYAATDRGVYYRNADMDDWISFSSGLPIGVRTTELEVFYGEGPDDKRLRASTYGRGMWETDLFGSETNFFAATGFLRAANNAVESFGAFEVNAGFYRYLNIVEVTGFDVNNIAISNGSISGIEANDNGSFTLTVQPDADGIVELSLPQGAALDDNDLLTYGSNTLKVLNLAAPEPFGILGPGGVGGSDDIALWLRADAFTTTNGQPSASGMGVGEWNDALGRNISAIQNNPEKQPILLPNEEGLNGFPALRFNGESTALISNDLVSSTDISVFAVAKGADSQWNEHGWIASARNPNGFLIHPWKSSPLLNVSVIDSESNYSSSGQEWIVDAAQTQLYGLTYRYHPEAQLLKKTVNGTVLNYPSTGNGARVAGTPIELRIGWDYEERYGDGYIAEEVVYNRRVLDSQRIILCNAMGAKYGIDMAPVQHYTRYDYKHEVAGVGRLSETDAHLDAKGSGIVRMTAIDQPSNGSFLIWGHNNANLTFATNIYPISSSRLARQWAFSHLGEMGEVSVRIDGDALPQSDGIGLIIANTDDFLPGSSPLFIPLQLEGDQYTASVQFPANGVFTIGVQPTVGVEDVQRSEVIVFPNPANDHISVRLNGFDIQGCTVQIVDLTGRELMCVQPRSTVETISVSRLAAGTYLLVVQKGKQRNVTRFVRQ